MLRYPLAIFVILAMPAFLLAQTPENLEVHRHRELMVQWDNDAFFDKDYYYTQGAHLLYVDAWLSKNPLNHVLFRLRGAEHYYGLGLSQEIYTPKDILDTLLNMNDRPYAGTLFLQTLVVSASPEKRLRMSSELNLGVLGPLSGAEQAQKLVHRWTDSRPPEGWDFQIKNRPYLNYKVQFEKELMGVPHRADLTAGTRVRVGNIHDDLQLSATLRLGKLNDQFKGYRLSNKKYLDNRHFEVYICGGMTATFVLYNATLMGGLVPPESEHEFRLNEINKLVASFYGGIHVAANKFAISGKIVRKTKEFEQGERHHWATIALYFRL